MRVGFVVDYVDLGEFSLCVLGLSLSASLCEFHVLTFNSSLTDATILISESVVKKRNCLHTHFLHNCWSAACLHETTKVTGENKTKSIKHGTERTQTKKALCYLCCSQYAKYLVCNLPVTAVIFSVPNVCL